MVYNPKLDWKDNESGGTPITAADLKRIEQGIADGDLTNQSSAASTRAGQIFEPIGLSDTTKTYVSDAIVASAQRRRMYDVRDYLGSDDIGAAINRAIGAAALDGYAYGKPGQVIIPPGNFAVATPITWRMNVDGVITDAHGVDLIGGGWGKTVLRPQGLIAAITHISQSSADALHDVLIANFEIDGSDQTLGGGSYTPSVKGSYMVKLRRVTVEHVFIHDTGATGLGHDYHDDCVIRDVIANGCGRLNDGTGGGGAGIGIGTGNWTVEKLLVIGSSTSNNKRDGLFFETQLGDMTLGARVIGHTSESNGGNGIADAGCRGLEVVGGLARRNAKDGFATYQGTIDPAAPGIGGQVRGLKSILNGGNGFHFDWTGRIPVDTFTAFDQNNTNEVTTVHDKGYALDAVVAQENGGHGVLIDAATTDMPGISVRGSDLSYNEQAGLLTQATGTPSIVDLIVTDNKAIGNGQNTSATRREGMIFRTSLTRPVIMGNKCTDPQSTRTQTYGMRYTGNNGIITDATIKDNDLGGNLTAPYTFENTWAGTTDLGFNRGWTVGPNSPEGSVIAPSGTMFRRTAFAGQSLYVKETTTGNTGWVLK